MCVQALQVLLSVQSFQGVLFHQGHHEHQMGQAVPEIEQQQQQQQQQQQECENHAVALVNVLLEIGFSS